MTYELKKVSVWSVAKISFVLGGALGFIVGLFMWFFMTMIGSLGLDEMGAEMSELGIFGAVGVVMPFMLAIFYAVITMIGNSIMAGIYNLFSGLLGGVEITLSPQQPPPTYTPPTYTPPAPPSYAPPQAPPPPPPADHPRPTSG